MPAVCLPRRLSGGKRSSVCYSRGYLLDGRTSVGSPLREAGTTRSASGDSDVVGGPPPRLPVHHKPAVHVEGLAGDLGGAVGGEEDHHVRDVLGRLPAAQREQGADFVAGPFLAGAASGGSTFRFASDGGVLRSKHQP